MASVQSGLHIDTCNLCYALAIHFMRQVQHPQCIPLSTCIHYLHATQKSSYAALQHMRNPLLCLNQVMLKLMPLCLQHFLHNHFHLHCKMCTSPSVPTLSFVPSVNAKANGIQTAWLHLLICLSLLACR